ncbi:hypothetical protein Vafri_8512 [Volvox africanus]|nr:hypothetical protein Vafri_8512 [Volvox africanus]
MTQLENILLRKEADGLVRAKLSDFGLTVAVDAAGRKVSPPQVLRAPGQSLEDVCASAPCGRIRRTDATTNQPRRPGHATAGMPGSQSPAGKGADPNGSPANGAMCAAAVAPDSHLQNPWDHQEWQRQIRAGRKALSHSHLPEHVTAHNGVGQGPSAWAGAPAGPQPAPGALPPNGGQSSSPGKGLGGAAGIRPWSAGQPQLQLTGHLSGQARPGVAKEPGPGAGATTKKAAQPPQEVVMLRREHISISWTGMQRRVTKSSSGDELECPGGRPTRVDPHGLHPVASQGALLSQHQQNALARPSPGSSRRSETGHMQVKMDQVNSLLQLGMGHKDYLPDMYQMTFKLTTQCGSVCYMAPEVARQQPYNQKSDVFSFGCIIFEVLTRQLLSDGIPEGNVDAAVEYLSRVSWSGWRPDLPAYLPRNLRLLISLCWHREPRLRPSFPTIATRLRELLLDLAMPTPQTKSSLVVAPPREPMQTNQQKLQNTQQKLSELQKKLLQQQQLDKAQQQKALLLTRLQQQLQQLLSVPRPPNKTTYQQAGGAEVQIHAKLMRPNPLTTFQNARPLDGGGLQATSGVAGVGQMDGMTVVAAAAQIQLEAQRQQQLQLQLQQLNAFTRTAGVNSAVIATRGSSGGPSAFTGAFNPPPLHVGNSVGGRMPSQFENSCVYTTAMGGHIPGMLLASNGGRAGSPSLETAVAVLQQGRATQHTATTSTGQRNSDGGPCSLPSPNSSRGGTRRSSGGPGHSPGLGSGPGQGCERVSRGNMPPSDGSGGVASVGSSFRRSHMQHHQHHPQHHQQTLELTKTVQGKDGCVWSCAVM